ncbi:MAG: hypothetical protein Ct9H300mP1_22500 [Planctomycetaceae bacterium]|nr:MAG: hypothetical protein Ct9H300mP1_22500 [Planctomycetaceae bacterium]
MAALLHHPRPAQRRLRTESKGPFGNGRPGQFPAGDHRRLWHPSIDEAALAAELGMELIVTDHHTIGETLPGARCWSTPGCRAASTPSEISVVPRWPSNWPGPSANDWRWTPRLSENEGVPALGRRPGRHRHDLRRDAPAGRKPGAGPVRTRRIARSSQCRTQGTDGLSDKQAPLDAEDIGFAIGPGSTLPVACSRHGWLSSC